MSRHTSVFLLAGCFVAAGCSDGEPARLRDSAGSALVRVSAEESGSNCSGGGQRVESGVDANADGTLDQDEVSSTAYVCNGAPGGDGSDGENGTNGSLALVDVAEEAVGANCAGGGQKISAGLDADANGTLELTEVTATRYLCHGADGNHGLTSLLATTAEEPGDNCAFGGQRVDRGLDVDGDGELAEGELQGQSYLCDGQEGKQTLFDMTAEQDGECASGGHKLSYGVDEDRSGSLEASEVTGLRYICDGATGDVGLSTLMATTVDEEGHCSAGGKRIDFGVDVNRDAKLDADEIQETNFVCNGSDGTNGASALVRLSPSNSCADGGQDVASGLDNGDGGGLASDGVLQDGEIDTTTPVCFGGGVSVADANGAALGRLAYVPNGGYMGSSYDIGILSNKGYVYGVYYYDLKVTEAVVYFQNADCTGKSYSYGHSNGYGMQYLGNFAVRNGSSVYKSTGAWADVGYGSYRNGGSCYNYGGTTKLMELLPSTPSEVGLPETLEVTGPLKFQ